MSAELLDDLGFLDKERPQLETVGFWKRLFAGIIDWAVWYFFLVVFVIILMVISTILSINEVFVRDVIFPIIGCVSLFIYFPLWESSKYQASPAKQWLGMIVVDEKGDRISFWRGLSRFLLKFLSYIIIGIGFVMVAFTKKNQGLHDIIASTLVVKNTNRGK